MMTPRWLPLLLLLSCGVSAQTDTNQPMVETPSLSQEATETTAASRAPWSSSTLEAVQHWPLQHGGRVKPFDTYAGFIMLKVNGKRSLTVNQEKLGPVAWALDCMLYPEIARNYQCIRVTNSEVLTNAGIDVSQRKRSSRWSFDDLLPALDQIFETAGQISETKEASNWSLIERQTIQLAQNVRAMEELFHAFDAARWTFPLTSVPELQAIYGTTPATGFWPLIAGVTQLEALANTDALLKLPEDRKTEVVNALQDLREQLVQQMQIARQGVAWFAPEQTSSQEDSPPAVWVRSDVILQNALVGSPVTRQVEALKQMEAMVAARDDRPLLQQQAVLVQEKLAELADLHGQNGRGSLEVFFYRIDFFYRALICFVLAFIIACLSWLKPESILPARGTWLMCLLGVILLTTGVTLRCIIQGRPPVTTLYETILFITACSVGTALVIESLDRRKIALTIATFLGSIGCFLSMKYELKEAISAGDTMPSLVAVLDTNFWLSTHVTSVTLGYSAGLLAAAIAHVWVIGKILGLRKNDKDFYKSITRMVYGTICFGLFFSVVGTILGGIWANYSWGRFWGWDPKENGALMICLAELIILHARMSGLVRERGFHLLVLVNGIIVAFSWWGVNLLNVGLHSYGFTDGIQKMLNWFYGVEGALIALCLLMGWIHSRTVSNSSGKTPREK